MAIDYDKLRSLLERYEENAKVNVSINNEEVESVISHEKFDGINLEKVETPIFNRFLNADMDSEYDLEAKKLMALGDILADDDRSGEEIAVAVDEGMVNAKVAYKVGNGDIDVTEAIEILIDRVAVRTDAFIQRVLDMDLVGEVITDIAAYVYPPVLAYKPIIKIVLKRAEPMVRNAISTGIKLVAETSKNMVRNISKKVETLVEILKTKAKSLALSSSKS